MAESWTTDCTCIYRIVLDQYVCSCGTDLQTDTESEVVTQEVVWSARVNWVRANQRNHAVLPAHMRFG